MRQNSKISPTGHLRLSGDSNRYFAPDFARGAMLFIIAVANAPYWLPAVIPGESAGGANDWWLFVRNLLITNREYSLFSLLLGFGCAVMVTRLLRSGMERRDVIRLIRIRGIWMMVFGCVHALIFQGDILGAYGLAMFVFAGFLQASGSTGRFSPGTWVVFTVTSILSVSLLVYAGLSGGTLGEPARVDDFFSFGVSTPLMNVLYWAFNSVLMTFASLLMPTLLLGLRLGHNDALREPLRYRRAIFTRSLVLTVISALTALIWAFTIIGRIPVTWWAYPLQVLGGVLGAYGLLWLLVGVSTWIRRPERNVIAELGRMSMTGYLLQTVVFGLIYAISVRLGVWDDFSPVWGLILGTLVYGINLFVAYFVARLGKPGVADWGLRVLTLGSFRRQ